MIILDIQQGTTEWYEARAGIPTASAFDRLITPTGKPSSQADAYYYQLLAEYATGETDEDSYSGFWMDRGKELEPEARLGYRLQTGRKISEVGFVYRDESKMVGCSPDGLALDGNKRGCEIKCPKKVNHAAYYLEAACPKKYIAQVQGSMWITEFDLWDFVSYHPDFEPFIVTIEKDIEFHKALDRIVPAFIERLTKGRESDRVLELVSQREQLNAA